MQLDFELNVVIIYYIFVVWNRGPEPRHLYIWFTMEKITATFILFLGILGQSGVQAQAGLTSNRQKPNVVIILTDDQGYGDLGCYGNGSYSTTHIDALAERGVRLTSFYMSQPVCTASRASIMTGSYANRVSMTGALNPTSTKGIHDQELLLSELLKAEGYATAIFGKWHLGNQAKFNPLNQGFDEYFGLPYSNDNSNRYHPIIRTFPPLPLCEGFDVVEEDPDQSLFTRRFTERAVNFIEKHRDEPFFLYVPHVMPHVPIFASEDFRGSSGAGPYGDVIGEIDWSVGQIRDALKRNGLEEHTLVIFASDNGPWLSYGEHAGSAGPLRGGKLTTFEGGVRVPCIMSMPGTIPEESECDDMILSMDWLPTIAGLTGAALPEKQIDGRDIWPLVSGTPDARSPHMVFYYYAGKELHAVRSGPWKLHLPHPYLEVNGPPGKGGKPANFENLTPAAITESGLQGIASRHGYVVKQTGMELYNLEEDLSESRNVAGQHPEVVQRLLKYAEEAREDLGDALTGSEGRHIRPAGTI